MKKWRIGKTKEKLECLTNDFVLILKDVEIFIYLFLDSHKPTSSIIISIDLNEKKGRSDHSVIFGSITWIKMINLQKYRRFSADWNLMHNAFIYKFASLTSNYWLMTISFWPTINYLVVNNTLIQNLDFSSHNGL